MKKAVDTYEELLIRFEKGPEVSVSTAEGEARGRFFLPPALDALDLNSLSMYAGGGSFARGFESFEKVRYLDPVQEVGTALFESLFKRDIGSLFRRAEEKTREAPNRGLRLRFVFGDIKPARVPWEFLYDPATRDFVALSARSSVVRSVDRDHKLPEPIEPPVRVLSVAPELSPEGVGEEGTLHHLAGLAASGQIYLEVIRKARFEDVTKALRETEHPFHILHYIGSGTSLGSNQLIPFAPAQDNPSQASDLKDASTLGSVLGALPNLRMVFLDACRTDLFAGELAFHCPTALGFRGDITTDAAQTFDEGFFESIAVGDAIESAVSRGRVGIDRHVESREWGLPVLFMAPGFDGSMVSSRPSPPIGPDEDEPEKGVTPTLSDPENLREWKRKTAFLSVYRENLGTLKEANRWGSDRPPPDGDQPMVYERMKELEKKIRELEGQLEVLEAEGGEDN